MNRLALLDQYLEEHRCMPFEWGSHDCCTFAAGWVLRLTGLDPMAWARGLHTAREALRVLRDFGGLDAPEGQLGIGPRWAMPAMARRGDIARVRTARGLRRAARGSVSGYAFGVVVAGYVAVPGVNGLAFVDAWEAAWRVD